MHVEVPEQVLVEVPEQVLLEVVVLVGLKYDDIRHKDLMSKSGSKRIRQLQKLVINEKFTLFLLSS